MAAWAAEAPEKIKKTENFADPFYISNLKECINGFIYGHTPQENALQERGAEVALKELKAVFFVKDFIGNREYRGRPIAEPPMHGRKIEVTFSDGENIFWKTEGYNPQKLGFFMFPADPQSNDLRIFVVNKNVSRVRFV